MPEPTLNAAPAFPEPILPDADQPYDSDGLRSVHNHEFLREPRFRRAYARGARAARKDYAWHWRVHVGLWAARTAARLEGDFVECGVGHGFMASAILEDLDWAVLNRRFFLLDTFAGVDVRYASAEELAGGIEAHNAEQLAAGTYARSADVVRANFSEWDRIHVIAGPVPETLPQVTATRIAFLHLDLNNSPPEVAALDALWDRIVPGAPILLDDYAYHGYRPQKLGMDAAAARRGLSVLSLPTGQGLMLKPPA